MTMESEVADLKRLVAGQQADLDERDRELLAILAEHAAEIERLEKGSEMKEPAVGDVLEGYVRARAMLVAAWAKEGRCVEAIADELRRVSYDEVRADMESGAVERLATEPARKKELAVGDVVQLASGGPSMTVTARVPAKGDETLALCRCMYFDGSLLSREVMVPELGLRVGSEP